ncbi:MAG: TldD/PmbA family protein [Thermoplasmata archaeon]|nr:TldD/PmbA family protein [Thermoplasmata archaeon]
MEPLSQSEESIGRALGRLDARSAYADAMAQAAGGHSLGYDPKATRPGTAPRVQGVVFRAWALDHWVEAAVSSLEPEAMRSTVDSLLKLLPTKRGPEPPGTASTTKGSASTSVRRPPEDVHPEDRVAMAKLWAGWALGVPGIATASVGISDAQDERLFLSSAGASVYQKLTRVAIVVVPIAKDGDKVRTVPFRVGVSAGYEAAEDVTEARVLEAARESLALLTAKAPPSGRHKVILDPSTTGTVAHESFGHGAEADQAVRDRSYLKADLGGMVGPESLTIVDDGTLPGAWGSIFFDDDGLPSHRTVLVDHGRFVRFLHDRATAAALGQEPTGNARRSDFMSRSYVRMTNTFIEGGDWTLDELIAEAKDGVLLERATEGVEDPLGGLMQIGVLRGRRIEHGELTDLLSSMKLSGNVLEFLGGLKGVSRLPRVEIDPGTCGKGFSDLLPAGTGGPFVLSEAVVGPG